jgi:hypothetical protein
MNINIECWINERECIGLGQANNTQLQKQLKQLCCIKSILEVQNYDVKNRYKNKQINYEH